MTESLLTVGELGDFERHALMLRLESIRLIGLVTIALSTSFATMGLVTTASMATSAGSDDVIEWRRGPVRAFAEGTRLP